MVMQVIICNATTVLILSVFIGYIPLFIHTISELKYSNLDGLDGCWILSCYYVVLPK